MISVPQTNSAIQDRDGESLAQDALVLKAFREHLGVICDPTLLDLLLRAALRPISNADVRGSSGMRRGGAPSGC